jgi:hypothetical protein
MDPARMFKESLTSRPELENSQGQKQTLQRVRGRSVHSRIADIALRFRSFASPAHSPRGQ